MCWKQPVKRQRIKQRENQELSTQRVSSRGDHESRLRAGGTEDAQERSRILDLVTSQRSHVFTCLPSA
ncbi:hypothetical protein CapIbe_021161 [Capra ibex]